MEPFVQFTKRDDNPQRSDTFFAEACIFIKSITPSWVFFTFFKLQNGTKLRKASIINLLGRFCFQKKTSVWLCLRLNQKSLLFDKFFGGSQLELTLQLGSLSLRYTSSICIGVIETFWTQKFIKDKLIKFKDFKLYQVFMYDFLCEIFQIFPFYITYKRNGHILIWKYWNTLAPNNHIRKIDKIHKSCIIFCTRMFRYLQFIYCQRALKAFLPIPNFILIFISKIGSIPFFSSFGKH